MSISVLRKESNHLKLINSGITTKTINDNYTANSFHIMGSTNITGTNIGELIVLMYFRAQNQSSAPNDEKMLPAPGSFSANTNIGAFAFDCSFRVIENAIQYGYYGDISLSAADLTPVAPFIELEIRYFVFKI